MNADQKRSQLRLQFLHMFLCSSGSANNLATETSGMIVYCVFMKLGGSNFTCDCFTLHHKFWLITRGWGNFQHDCFSCVFMKLSGSNVTCSCFTLHHIFWLIPRGHILLVGASLCIMNFDYRVSQSPFFFRKLVSRSTTRGRSAGFEIMEILDKTTSINFHEIWYLFQWTRIENETSRFCRFFICFCVPTVAHTTKVRKHPAYLSLLCFHETGWQ